MTPQDLKRRTMEFALRCSRLAESLPRTVTGRTIAGQLSRASTSVAANYRASCKARSQAEFVAKIGVVEEETDESGFWLEFIVAFPLMPETRVRPLMQEAMEIAAIMGRSRITASRKREKVK